ncbi:MAG: hypothetical protein Q9207_005394 [Kuettlingeria erythrocarpa]
MGASTPTCDVYHEVSSALDPLRRLRFKRGVRFITGHPYFEWGSQEPYAQCQKPECLGFANSFHKTRAIMEGDTVPSPFTSRQLRWLDLKEQVSNIVASSSGLDSDLLRIWCRMAAPKAVFDEDVKDCLRSLKDEWDNQRHDGRLAHYRRYERKRIPEQYWELTYYDCTPDGLPKFDAEDEWAGATATATATGRNITVPRRLLDRGVDWEIAGPTRAAWKRDAMGYRGNRAVRGLEKPKKRGRGCGGRGGRGSCGHGQESYR